MVLVPGANVPRMVFLLASWEVRLCAVFSYVLNFSWWHSPQAWSPTYSERGTILGFTEAGDLAEGRCELDWDCAWPSKVARHTDASVRIPAKWKRALDKLCCSPLLTSDAEDGFGVAGRHGREKR